jgi:hypothetical protein
MHCHCSDNDGMNCECGTRLDVTGIAVNIFGGFVCRNVIDFRLVKTSGPRV